MTDEQKANARRSLRRLAREAVVFALLGFVLVLAADFVLDSRHANPASQVQEQVSDNQKGPDPFATFGGHRYVPPKSPDVAGLVAEPNFRLRPPAGKREALFKLTGDKAFLNLSDAELMRFVSAFEAPNGFVPDPMVLAPNGEIGRIPAERLKDALAAGYRKADVFDVAAALPAVDKWDKYVVADTGTDKWNKYAVPSQPLPQMTWRENMLAWIHAFVFHFLIGSLFGFPGGLAVWGFYRMVRFALLG
jgi:hypothetical protein